VYLTWSMQTSCISGKALFKQLVFQHCKIVLGNQIWQWNREHFLESAFLRMENSESKRKKSQPYFHKSHFFKLNVDFCKLYIRRMPGFQESTTDENLSSTLTNDRTFLKTQILYNKYHH